MPRRYGLDVTAGNDVMDMAVRAVCFNETRAGYAHEIDCPAVAKGHGVTFKKSGMERSSAIVRELSVTGTPAGSAGELSSTSGEFGNLYPPSRLTGGSDGPISVPASRQC